MTHVYDIYETRLTGPTSGNPFLQFELSATFIQGNRKIQVTGFCDGNGEYVLRFMPDAPGAWGWESFSNAPALNQTGQFTALAARDGVHGPVRDRDRCHFAHADGDAGRDVANARTDRVQQGPHGRFPERLPVQPE